LRNRGAGGRRRKSSTGVSILARRLVRNAELPHAVDQGGALEAPRHTAAPCGPPTTQLASRTLAGMVSMLDDAS
jgi:hypothetical protein